MIVQLSRIKYYIFPLCHNRKKTKKTHPDFHFHRLFYSHNERMAELYTLNSQDG